MTVMREHSPARPHGMNPGHPAVGAGTGGVQRVQGVRQQPFIVSELNEKSTPVFLELCQRLVREVRNAIL